MHKCICRYNIDILNITYKELLSFLYGVLEILKNEYVKTKLPKEMHTFLKNTLSQNIWTFIQIPY